MDENKLNQSTSKALIKIAVTLLIYIVVFIGISSTDEGLSDTAFVTTTAIYLIFGVPVFSLFYGIYSCKLLRMVIVPNVLFFFAQIILSIWMAVATQEIGYTAALCVFSMPASLISGTVTRLVLMAADRSKKPEPENECDNETQELNS